MSHEARLLDDALNQRDTVTSVTPASDMVLVLVGGVVKQISATNLALAIDTTLVEDAIVNGVLDKAPSQNAVYDALALKLDVTTAAATYQPIDSDLTALASQSTTGLLARTGSGTAAVRTITGTSAEISVANGDGVSGNPTLSLPTALTFTGKTVTGGTFSGVTLSNNATFANGSVPIWVGNGSVNRVTMDNNSTNWTVNRTNSSGTYIDSPLYMVLSTGVFNFNSAANLTAGGTLTGVTLSGTIGGSPTASGAWTFTANPTISNAVPRLYLQETDAATDAKLWKVQVNGGVFALSILNDAESGGVDFLSVTRTSFTSVAIDITASALTKGGVAIPTISSSDTLSNKTLSSPTMSGTVGGSPTASGSWTFGGTTSFSNAAGHIYQIMNCNTAYDAATIYTVLGSSKWLVGLGATSGLNDYVWYSYAVGVVARIYQATGGMTLGSPTGGDKGTGTLNATAVYDDNSLLTCYPFEALRDGTVNVEKWDIMVPGMKTGHFGARKFAERLGTEYDPLDIDKYAQHWKDKMHLTSMPNKLNYDFIDGAMSTGEWVQRLVETVEIQAIHIDKLNQRLKVLEAA